MEEEYDCRPDVVELVWGTVAEVLDEANSDECLLMGVPRTLQLNQMKSQMLARAAGQVLHHHPPHSNPPSL